MTDTRNTTYEEAIERDSKMAFENTKTDAVRNITRDLKVHGHSLQKAAEIVLDAQRGNTYAINYLRTVGLGYYLKAIARS